ncbi:ABC transporter permease subunit [Buchananella hordeovulneris]|uniref:ABC transporter permease subunit n=1 Tax=Buchananella hordeovulneris TaxID=52770 RepID=UPI0026DAD28E|nr:ABC transporter permease subunit [Buchananella hordeovulneris]MDO5081008.1 ABC transporter permease subunit [Buchananella hordeovulneris]
MTSQTSSSAPPQRATARSSHARDWGAGFFVKLFLMCLVNALGIYGALTAYQVGNLPLAISMVVLLLVVNYIYFARKRIAGKYLIPGLVFLLIYQVFVMGYTGYVALTNYGQGHNSTKDDAITQILRQNEKRVEGSESVPVVPIDRDGEIGLALLIDGKIMVGDAQTPLSEAQGTIDGTRITAVDGATLITGKTLNQRQKEVFAVHVPVSDEVDAQTYRTETGATAFLSTSIYRYDEAADTLTNTETGVTYTAGKNGQFEAPGEKPLTPGWRVVVGFENFTKMFSDSQLAMPFLRAFLWSLAFAFLSVASTFVVGLVLAVIYNDPRVRGRTIYRSLFILPYAFPAFLSALVWRGMFNQGHGIINQVILGGADIAWLDNEWLAKGVILLVNMWLGFPYMFLVCTGALQAVPEDVKEAAVIDGAGAMRIFRSITAPLVFVATAPLLIASFAFNFNNFSLIYMLTDGGPNYEGLPYAVGKTDLLISMVYGISFDGAQKQYGLGAAMSIIIFVVVGLISWFGFRATRKLEEI